jgi:hypothetical protein
MIVQSGANQIHSFADAEERLLRDVGGDGDDEFVDELETPRHEILVPTSYRVEAAGVDRDAHESRAFE